jgi:hypothetical protein
MPTLARVKMRSGVPANIQIRVRRRDYVSLMCPLSCTKHADGALSDAGLPISSPYWFESRRACLLFRRLAPREQRNQDGQHQKND